MIVLLYALFIFVFTQNSASSASAMIARLGAWFPYLSHNDIVAIVWYLRKLIHIGGYFLALIMIYSAVLATPRLNRFPYSVSVILALALAASDEWYQTKFSHRSGNLGDVMVDLIGIVLAVAAVKAFNSIRNKSQKASSN